MNEVQARRTILKCPWISSFIHSLIGCCCVSDLCLDLAYDESHPRFLFLPPAHRQSARKSRSSLSKSHSVSWTSLHLTAPTLVQASTLSSGILPIGYSKASQLSASWDTKARVIFLIGKLLLHCLNLISGLLPFVFKTTTTTTNLLAGLIGLPLFSSLTSCDVISCPLFTCLSHSDHPLPEHLSPRPALCPECSYPRSLCSWLLVFQFSGHMPLARGGVPDWPALAASLPPPLTSP